MTIEHARCPADLTPRPTGNPAHGVLDTNPGLVLLFTSERLLS